MTKKALRSTVAQKLRDSFDAPGRREADRYLDRAIQRYEKSAPELSRWLEQNIPEGLTVFALPEKHRRRLRTSNLAEYQMKEIKRYTRVAMVFPNKKSVNRMVAVVLMEIDEN